MPDSFATTDDAAAYGFTLPAATADGLLARATQAIRDAAGYPVTQVTGAALRLRAECGRLAVPSLVVTAVSVVALVNDDGTTTALDSAAWDWDGGNRIRLVPGKVAEADRRFGQFDVTFDHGFATIPEGLVMLTGAVAFRLAVTPVAATAGIRSQSVGSVSWTVGEVQPGAALTDDEVRLLAKVIPVQRAWQVKT